MFLFGTLLLNFHMNTLTETLWTKPCGCIYVDISRHITKAVHATLPPRASVLIGESTYDLTSAIHFNLYGGIRKCVYERIDQFNNKFCVG